MRAIFDKIQKNANAEEPLPPSDQPSSTTTTSTTTTSTTTTSTTTTTDENESTEDSIRFRRSIRWFKANNNNNNNNASQSSRASHLGIDESKKRNTISIGRLFHRRQGKAMRDNVDGGGMAMGGEEQMGQEMDHDKEKFHNGSKESSSPSSSSSAASPTRQRSHSGSMLNIAVKVDYYEIENVTDPLYLAVATGDIETLKSMLDEDETLMEKEYEVDQIKPMHFATLHNQISVIELLLARGAAIDCLNSFHASPLHLACSKGYREAMQFLVSNGADVKLRDMYGYSPIHVALKQSQIELAEDLLLFGVDMNFKKFDGKTPLHVAAETGAIKSVQWLIEKGARTTVRDQKGNTFLFGAVRGNHHDLVRYLAKQPNTVCNFMSVNNTGSNIVHACVDRNLLDMVTLLSEIIQDTFVTLVNMQDKVMSRTPLHYAVQSKKSSMVEMLLMHEYVNPNLMDSRGQTPLHILLEQPEEKIQDDLLKKILMVPRVQINIKGGQSKKTCRQLLTRMKRFHRYLKEIKQMRNVYASMIRSNDVTVPTTLNTDNQRPVLRLSDAMNDEFTSTTVDDAPTDCQQQ